MNTEKLRILLITQGVSRLVQPILTSGHQVVGILESMPRDYSPWNRPYSLVRFLKKAYSLTGKRYLLLSDLCVARQIPYYFIWKHNTKEVAAWVEHLRPDLIVIFSMSQLLGMEILRIPRFGAINLHPSFLPAYRGPNPDFWQYYNMELNPGVTVHYVDSGEDTGDIIYQQRLRIPLGMKSPARLDKLIGELGVSLMLRAIDAIARREAPRTPQPSESPTSRASNLKPDEHLELIDWRRWPIERVWHVLRGTELWLNAVRQPTGLMAGQRWSILGYEKVRTPSMMTGRIGQFRKMKCIFARDGVIYIRIQFNIKRTILRIIGK